ncbi:MAG: FAD:protein FMN transferase [Pseudomonadota bacterium]|nr:FAD:protein FMN transferase [Pseudomonadota bacterium]
MAIGLTLIVGVVLAGCGQREPAAESWELSGDTMGTRYHVTLPGAVDDAEKRQLENSIEAVLESVDAQMSTYRPDSALSVFNRSSSTEWLDAPPPLAAVIEQALEFSRLSGGAFDVTVGPLVNLWGFGPAERIEAAPEAAEIAGVKSRVGFQNLSVRTAPPAIRKAISGLYVDLSAIAKGYAVDRVARVLDETGRADYLVEIGGEVRTRGRNAAGEAWRIAIEQPLDDTRAVQRVVALSGQSMATSGDYRNFFEIGGQRYSHTIDPHTGAPVRHRLASVSVVAASAAAADALATALLVLGPEAGRDLAEREGIAALFISRADGGFEVRTTAGFPPSAVIGDQ